MEAGFYEDSFSVVELNV